MGESGARQRGTKHVGGRVFLSSLGGLLVICGLSMGEARAAESCRDTAVASIPSRPTVASATGVTLCGALELEYGLQRTWPGGGAHRSDLFWRPAFRCYAEARLPLVRHGLPQPHRRQRKPQGIRRQLVRSEVPFPDPDQAGSQPGRALHGEGAQRRACPRKFGKGGPAFAFLVSKDVKPFYFDFNLIPQLVGPLAGNGFDHNLGLAWATWLPVTKRWTVVAEPYGFTALNAATPGFASVMGGFSLQVHPRLYLDAGLEVGASHFAPRKRVYGGVTFAAANLYKRLQPQPR